jgi:uncharacterized protein YndB with AHSA1/START domain
MIDIQSEADIRCDAEKIFDLITDFSGQDRWLPHSSAFHGTEVSADPVTLGTTYREPGPFGVRNGTVTEFERPRKVTFHQPMTMRLHSGTVDVTLRYTLTPNAGSTHVSRVVTLGIPGRCGYCSRSWCASSGPRADAPCSRSRPTPTGSPNRRAQADITIITV